MKKTVSILFLSFFSLVNAQQSANTSGNNISGSTGSVCYSVGQIDYYSQSGSTGSTSQGVQQPYEFFTLGNNDFSAMTLQAIIYPNPTAANINLKITKYDLSSLSFQLFDILGKSIGYQNINSENTLINTENLSFGTYLLQVLQNNKIIKTFKIIKK